MHYPQIQPHWGLGFQFINFGANMIKHSVGYNYLQDSVLAKSANKSLTFMETVAAVFAIIFGGLGALPALRREKHQYYMSKTADTFTLFLNL